MSSEKLALTQHIANKQKLMPKGAPKKLHEGE
jgi:hypothetical protein